MPSPVAHGLAGLAVAALALRRRARSPEEPRPLPAADSGVQRLFWIVALAFAANAADLDFLPGFLIGDPNRFHHRATHTVLAALVFGLGTTVVSRMAGLVASRRFGLLMGFSYLTHIALDVFTRGTTEPYGMEIWRPFSPEPFLPPFHLFLDIRRDGSVGSFLPSLIQRHNAEAIVRELLIMGGVWAVFRMLSSLRFTLNGAVAERKTPQ
jgi:inner membrane protein